MRISLRGRLWVIVGSSALALLVIIVTSMLVTQSVQAQLEQIQGRQIPRLELGPQLEADFASLKRSYQDAVAAHDLEALERASEVRDRIFGRLATTSGVLDPTAAAAFREALSDYHDTAVELSRRMIAGQGGEEMVERIAAMQKKQARAQDLLHRLVAYDPQELKAAFAAARDAQAAGSQTRLGIMLLCLGVILLLSVRLARSMVASLSELQGGLARFGKGQFDEPIDLGPNKDELVDVARNANAMATSLADLARERERRDWIKTGIMELGKELQGELEEEDVATRAARLLARTLEAPAAALYVLEGATLRLAGHYALSPGSGVGDAAPSFALGEGLVGEAARSDSIAVIDNPPSDFLRVRSGLGDAVPRCLALVPLLLDGRVMGVVELAAFHALSGGDRELLASARNTIAIALAVAQSRAAARRLLATTQDQATRLMNQEEELKSANEELRCQQEELRQANEVLASQRSTLQIRNTDLQEIGRQLEQKAAELATVSAYKSQFLANMSHELRTPLNSMLLLSKLLEDNPERNLTKKQVEYARTVHSAGRDLLALINQVLDLAKVESGKQQIKRETVRLADLLDRVLRTFRPLAEEKGLGFSVAIEPGLPSEMTSDEQRIGQILTNLLGNAVKFTEKGEVKLVISRHAATMLAFRVTDTGPGIAAEDQERVFAAFEQVAVSSQRHKPTGTGLGLSISRELAGLLGGELRLESKPGVGSTFSLVLPETLPSDSEDAPLPRSALPAPAPAAASATTRPKSSDVQILVIEDDPVFAGLLGDIIRERGLVHLTARDGAAGLKMARELQPRGIILDVKLPDTDGWRIMEQLRADPQTSSIPVHFITGVDMPDRGFAMGAAGYLMKPADRRDLVAVVESLRPSHQGEALRFLVVEGNADLGDTLLEQLAREGLSARRVPTGREAIELLGRERFACLIVDLAAPDVDELELLEKLRAHGPRDMPAVVIYASRPLSRAEAKRLEAYAEAVVLKEGASTERLLDEIRLFVRRLEAGLPRRGAAPAVAGAGVRLEGKKLLVVDDDMRTVYALSATLRAKGAEVLVAETGAVALDLLSEAPDVHAVLMDIMMPEMDGYEAMRRIRQQERFARLPIVALTAKAMKGDLEKCLAAGATDYLPKPIDPEALLTKLQARLAEREPGG